MRRLTPSAKHRDTRPTRVVSEEVVGVPGGCRGGGAVTTDIRKVITVYDAEESYTSNHTLMLGEQIFRI